jgi:hypothetical protein
MHERFYGPTLESTMFMLLVGYSTGLIFRKKKSTYYPRIEYLPIDDVGVSFKEFSICLFGQSHHLKILE